LTVYNAEFDETEFPDAAEGAEGEKDVVDDDMDGDESDADDEEEKKAAPFRDPPIGQVRMRPSSYNNIPSTVFIEYPPELKIKRIDTNVLEDLGKRQMFYTSHWERICIRNAFVRAGFEKTTKGPWTAMWSKHQNEEQMQGLNCLQKVNHFPHSWCIGRKDRLVRTMQAMHRLHGNEFNFHPPSFILPTEREAAHRQIAMDMKAAQRGTKNSAAASGGLWIIKPVASSCGRGISVISGSQVVALHKNKKLLVQKYIADPYLIEQNKFDLRMYVLVTGVDPMRIYIFKEGLTRISTSAYSLRNIDNKFAHLTNYSINKKSKDFKAASETFAGADNAAGTTDDHCETEGFKWSLTAFKRWLAKREGEEKVAETFKKVDDMLIKTMLSAESTITPQLHANANYRSNCFELFGCDVLLDSKLQPHLIEVNISPSLAGSSPLDKRIKGTLIADIMHTLGIYPHDNKLLKKFDELGSGASQSRLTKKGSSKVTSSRPGSAGFSRVKAKSAAGDPDAVINPFKFGSMSKMMAAQDAWRKSPIPENISLEGLGDNNAVWMMLLMAEDEFDRCASTQFVRKHPIKATAAHYNSLYFSSRFSDQLLARWVIEGGAKGALSKFIPERFLSAESLLKRVEKQKRQPSVSVDLSRELGISGKLSKRQLDREKDRDSDSPVASRPGGSVGRLSPKGQQHQNAHVQGYGIYNDNDDNTIAVQQRLIAMAAGSSSRRNDAHHLDYEGSVEEGADPLECFGVSELKYNEDVLTQSASGMERPRNPAAFTPLTTAEAYDVVKNGLLRRGRGARKSNSDNISNSNSNSNTGNISNSKPPAGFNAAYGATTQALRPWRESVGERPQNPVEHQSRPSNHANAVFQQRQMQMHSKWDGDESHKYRSRSNPATSRPLLQIEQPANGAIMVRDASKGIVALPHPPASSKTILAEKQAGRKISAPRMKM